MAKVTGSKLNRWLTLGARHARYHKDGYWYDQLQQFPGVLFDKDGFVLFETEAGYLSCAQLRHPNQERSDGRPGTLSVPTGISSIEIYVNDERVTKAVMEIEGAASSA